MTENQNANNNSGETHWGFTNSGTTTNSVGIPVVQISKTESPIILKGYPYNNYSQIIDSATLSLEMAKKEKDEACSHGLSVSSIFLFLLCPEALINEIWHHKDFGLAGIIISDEDLKNHSMPSSLRKTDEDNDRPIVRWYFAPLKWKNAKGNSFNLDDKEFVTIKKMVKMRNNYIHTNEPGENDKLDGFDFSKNPNKWTPENAQLIHDKFWESLEKLNDLLGNKIRELDWMRRRYNEPTTGGRE